MGAQRCGPGTAEPPSCLTLKLTNRCPAQCAHCCTSSGPESWQGPLDYGLAETALLQSLELGCFDHLSFTGGEALVYMDDVLSLSRLAHSHGYTVSVVTNGFWAGSPRRAHVYALQLKRAGVTTIKVSTSPFHRRYIPTANVANAWVAAEDIGLEVMILHASLGEESPPSELDSLRRAP